MSSISESKISSQTKPDNTTTSTHHGSQSTPYLDISSRSPLPYRRSSHASILSDLSDLDYMSNDHSGGLLRTLSNVSNLSTSYPGPVPFRQRLRNLYQQNYGALLVLLSQVFGSAMNVITRLLEQPGAHGEPMHPFQILFVRQALTALLCTTYALATKSIPHFPLGPPDRKVRFLLVCRGVFGFFGVFGMYFSLLYMPLSEATVLTFLAPILTCYICSLVLPGENFTRQQKIASFVSLIGVICIAQPVTLFSSFFQPTSSKVDTDTTSPGATTTSESHDSTHPTPSQHLLAIAIAMLGVCGATGAMTSIRAIGTRAHAFISINYFSVLSTIVSLIALIIIPSVSFRLPGNLIEWGLLISLGVCGFILQGLLTMGLAYGGPASKPEQTMTSLPNPPGTKRMHVGSKAIDEDIEMHARPIPLPSAPLHDEPTPSSSHPLPSTIETRTYKSESKPLPHPSGNRATSMVYCQMLFALAADKTIFGTTLSIWSWFGIGLILSGAVWVATAKDGSESESESRSKRAQKLRSDRGRGGSIPDEEGFIARGEVDVGAGSAGLVYSKGEQGRHEEGVGLLGGGIEEETHAQSGFGESLTSSPRSSALSLKTIPTRS